MQTRADWGSELWRSEQSAPENKDAVAHDVLWSFFFFFSFNNDGKGSVIYILASVYWEAIWDIAHCY